MPEPVLILDQVGKQYRLPSPDAASARWWQRLRRPKVDFWALQGVDLQVDRGQAVGIIGHNGAGKSTMLKILTGITAPSTGELRLRGRVAALLEVGSGFHPELTGRENIFLSGTVLGMTRSEIHKKLDQIIDFAEVRPFIDLPVKRFSSGMFVRLGFSIAAHMDPTVLLLDEVLAVGDARFQQKCLAHVSQMRDSGVTILFISHDLRAVEQLCPRCLLLQKGQIIYDGPTPETVRGYQQIRGSNSGIRRVQHDYLKLEIQEAKCFDDAGHEIHQILTGECLTVRVRFLARERLRGVTFTLEFWNSGRQRHAQLRSAGRGIDLAEGHGQVEFRCDSLLLRPDLYDLEVRAEEPNTQEPLDCVAAVQTLPVQSPEPVVGEYRQPFRFRSL